jgi:hypothetical protein
VPDAGELDGYGDKRASWRIGWPDSVFGVDKHADGVITFAHADTKSSQEHEPKRALRRDDFSVRRALAALYEGA